VQREWIKFLTSSFHSVCDPDLKMSFQCVWQYSYVFRFSHMILHVNDRLVPCCKFASWNVASNSDFIGFKADSCAGVLF